MKAILISIQSPHACNILNLIKLWEIRKKFPKDYVGWVYIYCTKDTKYKYGGLAYFGYGGNYCVHLNNNKTVNDFMDFKLGNLNDVSWTIQNDSKERVVARFWCDKVEDFWNLDNIMLAETCLTKEELHDYLKGNKGYAIHITNLEIFDKPKEISEFKHKETIIAPYMNYKGWDYLPLTRAPESWCYVEV